MAKFSNDEQGNNLPEGLENYLTVKDAAAFLGISPSTLRNWDRKGKLKARRHPINGYRLYERRDLQRLLDSLRKEEDL